MLGCSGGASPATFTSSSGANRYFPVPTLPRGHALQTEKEKGVRRQGQGKEGAAPAPRGHRRAQDRYALRRLRPAHLRLRPPFPRGVGRGHGGGQASCHPRSYPCHSQSGSPSSSLMVELHVHLACFNLLMRESSRHARCERLGTTKEPLSLSGAKSGPTEVAPDAT